MSDITSVGAKPKNSLTKRTLWTYTTGGIGRDMSYTLYSMYLLSFILYTKQLTNAQFAAISTIMIICRIWDAVNDPIMGGIIENTKSKWGKFKPWILLGVLSNAVVLVLLFSAPLTGWSFVVFFAFMYLLWDITFTMNDIGYWSMLPSLTSDMKERNKLTSMANLFAGMGGILTVALVPILTAGKLTIGGNAPTAYVVVTVIIASVFIGCQVMTVVGVQEREKNVKVEESMGIRKMVKVIFNNDQLLWVALVMLFYNLGSGIITGIGTNYIYFAYGYNGSFVTVFAVIFGAATGLVMILFPILSAKLTRRVMITIATGLIVSGYIGMFLVAFVTSSFYVLCAAGLFVGIGQGVFYMVITINIANTVEYNEWKTGRRNEGLIFSIRPFTAKLGSALQQLVVMVVYLVLNVTDTTNAISAAENAAKMDPSFTETMKLDQIKEAISLVPSNTTVYMRAAMTFIPAVLLICAFIVLRKKCIIDEVKYAQMLEDIERRKQEIQH
ncbi:MAG: MFS transporter [Acutalibacteraceae bacterium]